MSVVRRALLLSTSERYIVLGSNFLTIAIVSRILTPAEIGVSVIGMAIVGFASSVREFASTSFLIQHKELARSDIQSAFTVMLIFTLVTAGALAVLAPHFAAAYEQQGLSPYLRVIALSMLIDLFPGLVATLMRREMAFGKVAVINISGAIVGMVVTIGLAHNGFSYMSFAGAWLATSCITALLALAIRWQPWIFRPTLRHWRRMVEFGGYNGVTALLAKAYEMVPYLLLGWFLTPQAAALFNRSMMICQLPDRLVLSGAISVVLPAFSAAVRDGKDVKQPYLNALALITALLWPVLLVIAVLAHPIVEVLLGRQWLETVPLIRIIAVASLFAFSCEMNYPVMVSLGAIRDVCIRALISFPASAAMVAAAVYFGGLEAAAWSMMVVIPFQAFVSLTFLRHRLGLEWGEIASALGRSAVVALASIAGPIGVVGLTDFNFALSLGAAIVAAILAAVGWLIAMSMTRHPLLDEIVLVIPILRRVARPAPAL
ncbi:oligosaccharide flippase family protein [Aminobacter sp. HY435]|uniref:oligosaccharide flippase family protein n=1 Tax=Aminobacter sp. HY435 TaxID=2970917 RepID=UPI0022B97A97|nr:oligosaccharide flippase family protein [Aminobacter sp. HY435]